MSVRMVARLYPWLGLAGLFGLFAMAGVPAPAWFLPSAIGYVAIAALGYWRLVRCPRCRTVIWPQSSAPFHRTPSVCQTFDADLRRTRWRP